MTKFRIIEVTQSESVTYRIERRVFFIFWRDYFNDSTPSLESAKLMLNTLVDANKPATKKVVFREGDE